MTAYWIVLILCFAAVAVDGYLIGKLWDSHKQYSKVVEEHERNIVCLSDALVKTNKNVADLTLKFSKVEELIDAAKEHEQAAAKSEKQFQDGFASIMGYDFNVAMGKKNDDG